MNVKMRSVLWLSALMATQADWARAVPVINEIMYHPLDIQGQSEAVELEWLEIHNPDGAPVDVSGWQLVRGVRSTIPSGTVLPAGGYLVVAADVAAFQGAHAGFDRLVVGSWDGTLSNGGEAVALADGSGAVVDEVSYADEGGWALRVRGAVSFGHRGWEWDTRHDGGGNTLAKIVPGLPAHEGQNWNASAAVGGTPGAANWSTLPAEAYRFALGVRHEPEIPRSGQPIKIHATLPSGGITNRVCCWRVAGNGSFQPAYFAPDLPVNQPTWQGVATLPPQPDGTVIEYYIDPDINNPASVNDTLPRKARTSDPGVLPEVYGNACNFLVHVDDSFDPARDFTVAVNHPVMRVVMTPADEAELQQLQTTSSQADSEATFNGAFIWHDGSGTEIVQNAGVRNRGQSSAFGPPNNYHLSFPSDDPWRGRNSIHFNCQYGYSQVLGNVLFARAGIAPQDAVISQLRINGRDLAENGGRMYGRYALLEGRNNDWATNHYPLDPDGNFYRLDDHEPGPVGNPPGNLASGEFRYEGTNPASYRDTFIKETNKVEDDYSDLMQLTRVVSAPTSGGTAEQPALSDDAYPAAVAAVLDLDHFFTYIATDALLGNQEGGLQSGRADDVSIYRGVVDPRFRFVPHDLDDVFDIGAGVGNPVTRSIFSYDESEQQGNTGVVGLRRLFNHPALVPKYYAALLDALDRWFNPATIDPIIDRLFQGWVPDSDGDAASPNRGIQEIKAFIDARRANVLSQIEQSYSLGVSGTNPTSPEGYAVTTTGAVTLGGNFNVARTYSITVNGEAAQWFYRRSGNDLAGSWKFVVPAGGGPVIRPGLNNLVVRFWDGLNGTGQVVHERFTQVLWDAAPGTMVTGTLTPPGSLALLAPSTYVPGVPVLVRVDLRDSEGALQRAAWNTTVTLAATNGVALNPSTITLYNGMGSALVNLGSTAGGGTIEYFRYGSGGTGGTAANSGTPGSTWKYRGDFTTTSLAAFIASAGSTWKNEGFDDSGWSSIVTETGYGDNDENRAFPRVDYNPVASGTQSAPVALFRNTCTIDDVAALASLTGQVKFDDSCTVYVNGVEVYRHGDLSGNAPLSEYTEENTDSTRENATDSLTVPLALVRTGVNTIAVEVHQHDPGSSDITFDLRLQGALTSSSTDPGDFTLTATAGVLSVSKPMVSLGEAPGIEVSGPLPAGPTTWSGVVRVTGDVTVPAGATLTVTPGTHILMAGTVAAGDSAGADLIVNGTLAVNGTSGEPVSLTCADPAARWGQIHLNNAQPTTVSHALISRGAHSPGVGHTGRGPVFRLSGSALTLLDSALGDAPGKALYSSGDCALTVRRSLMARLVTGPEVGDGCAVLVEDSNIQECLPVYRESNAPVPDDEDCFYVHNGLGRPMDFRRSVFARCGDDVLDCLGGPVNVEDCILRDGWDKGISLLNNNLTVSGTQIIDCDKGIAFKNSSAGASRQCVVTRCTIVSEEHDMALPPWGYATPPSSPDPDTPATAIWTQWKPVSAGGTPTQDGIMNLSVNTSILQAALPLKIDDGPGQYSSAPTTVKYSCPFDSDTPGAPIWPGPGNLSTDPLFSSLAADDYRLAAESPAIDAGDPALTDPDASRADMGAFPTGTSGGGGAGEIRWSLAGSPYRVTANTTVPAGVTLRIDPGVNIQFGQNVRLRVNGRILADGTPARRIVFSHVPGVSVGGDVDPIKLGVQSGAPKWGGVRVYDSMAQENVFRFCDFINAQGTSPLGSENYGSVGFIRSWAWVDHCTFAGTHLRMCYGRNSSLTVTHTVFPDMFVFDAGLGRIEEPTTDFVAAADNSMEPLKVEFPTTDPEVANNDAFPNGLPRHGHWRVYFNQFNGNRGHQDVFDCDSGRWAPRDANGRQTNGQFVIDCRYNHFRGLAGDEHIDLGGDGYIASNIFENARKDFWTNDTGYSNAISSGDKGEGTTILMARNVCFDLDHVINCKSRTATIFEHNTVANIHPDYLFQGESVTQQVVCAPINFFIPQDGPNPSYGDGAYMGFNIVSNVPRLFSGADTRKINGTTLVNDITTKIEFFHNLLDAITDPEIGPNHPGSYTGGTYGPNQSGTPGFRDSATDDFRLRTDSLARGTAPGGLDYGATIAEWAYLLGGPSSTVAETTASFTIGGPGLVAYKWRLDGGPWSSAIQIGNGGALPRTAPTVRQATLTLTDLAPGPHTLEVLGQDMAGNWQNDDPARGYDGAPQAAPTIRQWSVDLTTPLVRLNEIMGDTHPDTPTRSEQFVELVGRSAGPIDLNGWSLSDQAGTPGELPLTGSLLPGLTAVFSLREFRIDNDGDGVFLFDPAGALQDSVVFGPLPAGYSLSRTSAGQWTLSEESMSQAINTPARLSDSSQIVVNEWLAAGAIRYRDDWVELANLAPFPASLAGLALTDTRFGQPTPFPPLSFIGGQGYVKLIADGDAAAGPNHTAFRIDSLTEELLLFATDGTELDNVRLLPQVEDISQGRVSGGGLGGIASFALGTAGAANGTDHPGYANALAVLNSLRITEIMYNPAGGNSFEFIELVNVGPAALDLGDSEFYNGINFVFPAGFVLAPGAEIVLVRDLAAFRNRYGTVPRVAGVYSGALDNSGEQLALRLPSPWDANVLWFEFEAHWHNTNGSGYSLQLVSTSTPIADYGNRSSWTASTQLHGSPAGWIPGPDPHPTGLAAWLTAHRLTSDDLALDSDSDSLANALEFALNSHPHSPAPPDGPNRLPVLALNPAGRPTFTVDLPTTDLPGGHGCPGVTYSIQSATSLSAWTTLATKSPTNTSWTDANVVPLSPDSISLTPGPDGLTRITITNPLPVSTGLHRFLRLHVRLTP
ncbi:MAG: lamin tail domain-containing protein [Verrucomicrobiales bacterium]